MDEVACFSRRHGGHELDVWVDGREVRFRDDGGEPTVVVAGPPDDAAEGRGAATVRRAGESIAIGYRGWIVLLRPRQEWLLVTAETDKSGTAKLVSKHGG